MKAKVIILLATVAALHLVLGGLFLAGGCAQEDPPMPPGIYVPPTKDASGTAPARSKSAVPESVITPADSSIFAPQDSAHGAKDAKVGKTAPEKTGAEISHKVAKGDSLWSISKKYSITIEELALFNNLPANAKLKVGQTILVPPSGKAGTAPAAKAAHKAAVKAPAAKTEAKAAAKTAHKATAKSTSKKAASKDAAAKDSASADGSYVVKAGDNFSTIAKKCGVKVSDITAANPGISSNKLKVGQKINLGGNGSAASADKAVAKPSENGAAPAEGSAAAPAAGKAQNMDSLLEDIPNPDAAPGATAKPAESAPVASKEAVKAVSGTATTPAPAAATDTDKLEDLADGTGVAVTTGAETTLAKLAVKYKVKEADVKLLNPAIPADGKIKPGMVIKLP